MFYKTKHKFEPVLDQSVCLSYDSGKNTTDYQDNCYPNLLKKIFISSKGNQFLKKTKIVEDNNWNNVRDYLKSKLSQSFLDFSLINFK